MLKPSTGILGARVEYIAGVVVVDKSVGRRAAKTMTQNTSWVLTIASTFDVLSVLRCWMPFQTSRLASSASMSGSATSFDVS